MALAPTKAMRTEGTKVFIGTTDAVADDEDWVQIKRCTATGPLGPVASMQDVTALEDYAREKQKGMVDFGDVDLEMNRIITDAGQIALKAAAADEGDIPYNFKIEFDDAITAETGTPTKMVFKAVVLSFQTQALAVGSVRKVKSQLAITGAVVETVAT